MVIDADAHVVETEQTWDYLDQSDKKFRPQLFQSSGDSSAQYWFLDGKIIGFRNPTLTEQELDALSKQTGRQLQTAQEARELRDVELRLQHMDRLGIDVQVLHNTMWITRVAERPDAEIALCMAWNRWMAEVWKQAEGRLVWSCVVPAMTISEAVQQIRFARQNGSVAVCLRPFEGERQLVDPYFYPIYEEATRLNMAMAIHIANASSGSFQRPTGKRIASRGCGNCTTKGRAADRAAVGVPVESHTNRNVARILGHVVRAVNVECRLDAGSNGTLHDAHQGRTENNHVPGGYSTTGRVVNQFACLALGSWRLGHDYCSLFGVDLGSFTGPFAIRSLAASKVRSEV